MHVAFVPYGERYSVERFFRNVESQSFKLRLTDGDKEKFVFVSGQIRELPFGVKEIVFPKEYADLVLNTLLGNTAPNRGKHHLAYKPVIAFLRKLLKYKDIPEYNKDNKMLWDLEYVSIIPLGVRYDDEVVEAKDMGYKGWTHEAL